MTDFIEIHVDEDEVMRGLDLQERLAKVWLKDFLDSLADKGVEVLHMHAPGEGKPGNPYSTDYTQRHIDRSHVAWQPGGAGGGGAYEAIVGVKAGTSRHPIYPERGTGIWGYLGRPYRSLSGNLMHFFSIPHGHVISVYQVAGQRPQRFLYETWRDLAIYTDIRMTASTVGLY